MTDDANDTEKLARFLFGTNPGLKADDDEADEADLLFVGDMTARELEEMLAPMLADAIEREWQKALQSVSAPKLTTATTTTKAKRTTSADGLATFKG